MFLKYIKRKKKLILIVSLIFFIPLIINLTFNVFAEKKLKEDIKFWIDDNINYKFDIITNILTKEKNYLHRYYNDYNEEFLPETQTNDFDFSLKKLNFIRHFQLEFLKENPYGNDLLSFFIEVLDDETLLIIDSRANTYVIKNIENKNIFEKDDVIKIKNNLVVERVLDTFLHEGQLFISFETDDSIQKDDNCKRYNLSQASFDLKKLDFKSFFHDKTCQNLINSGRMQFYEFQNKKGLLFAVSGAVYDNPTNEPQDDSSMFGKILFKEFRKGNVEIFSKGHRLILGLLVHNDVILSTENGPRGGDEINKILYKGNYGWPIASYGRRYDTDYEDNSLNYKNNHTNNGFIEPIFSFIPSIGISEIINIPNDFIENWVNNFLIASLNKRSIFRVKFDNDYSKIIFSEEIYIGKRIRDIKYLKKKKKILLALEDRAEIGVLMDK